MRFTITGCRSIRLANELCSAALAEHVDARPSARELGDRIQQYLDGDRDLEHRRVLAAKLLVDARVAVDSGERALGVRLAGRALALDPENEGAAGLVISLVTTVPDVVPPEVEQVIAAHDREAMRARSRRAFFPVLGFYLLTPFLSLLVVNHWLPLIAVYGAVTALAALAFINWRIGKVPVALWLVANLVTCVVFTRLSGPFVLTPVLVCSALMSAGAQPWLNDRPWALVLITIIAVVTPFGLEEVGLFGKSWTMTTSGVASSGTIFERGHRNVWPLFWANLMIVVLTTIYARAISRDRRVAQRALIVQTWHLRQLLPRSR